MNYKYLTFTIEDRLATITLNRPKAGNTLNLEFSKELEDVTRLCQINKEIGAVLINANGPLFCGGGDLDYMVNGEDDVQLALKKLADSLHVGFASIARIDVPVVAAVNGAAAGIGLSLALIADITIASEKAVFVPAYTAIGVSPDGGLTHMLPRIIGQKRAQEMLLCNRKLSAQEAESWGMINRVTSADELADVALKTATQLAQGPTLALASIKSLLTASSTQTIESQMHLEGVALAANSVTEDGQAGITAFLNKTKPVFTGR